MANEYYLTGATLAEICKINTPAASLAAELDACKLGIANDKHHVGFKDKDASYFRTCGWDSSGQALLDNLAYIKGRNAGDTAYRKLIGIDGSNILKIGQDTDISAVTFGTTAQQAQLDSTGLTINTGYVGIGRVATAPLDLYAATASMTIESSTGTNYADIEIKNTAGTLCMGLEQSTAGTLLHGSTAYAGVICHTGNYPLEFGTNDVPRLRIGNTAPIIEIGSPTTSDDSGTKWDSTYLKGVCRVGTYLSLFDYSGTVAASQMLFNAYTYASTGVIGANAQKRRKNYITAALEMNSDTGIGLFVGDAGAEDGAITWARHLQCFTGVTRFGGVLEEVIDVEFWGEDQKIAVFYGHLNTMEFYDYAGTALTWISALSPNDGRLIFNNNKILNFGGNGQVSHVFDGTNYKINGRLPTSATNINDWYIDNSDYVRIKLS